MKTLTIRLDESRVIDLGKRGENEATQVVFDVTEWLETVGDSGTFVLLVEQEGLETPYTASIVAVTEENAVRWIVRLGDTRVSGFGRCELQYYMGNVIVKSRTWRTRVCDALGEASTTPPPEFSVWIDEVLAASVSALASRDAAAASAAQAEESATATIEASESAKDTLDGIRSAIDALERDNTLLPLSDEEAVTIVLNAWEKVNTDESSD